MQIERDRTKNKEKKEESKKKYTKQSSQQSHYVLVVTRAIIIQTHRNEQKTTHTYIPAKMTKIFANKRAKMRRLVLKVECLVCASRGKLFIVIFCFSFFSFRFYPFRPISLSLSGTLHGRNRESFALWFNLNFIERQTENMEISV